MQSLMAMPAGRRVSRHPRRSTAIVAVVAAVAGCGVSTTSPSLTVTSTASSRSASQAAAVTSPASVPTTPSGSSGVNTCQTRSLSLRAGTVGGAGGTLYTAYYLTNRGSRPCLMFGYPGVAALDAAGRIVQHPAVRSTQSPMGRARQLRLAPGSSARFELANVDNVPNPDCKAGFPARTLQVYPPGQTSALRLTDHIKVCDLQVGPVTSG